MGPFRRTSVPAGGIAIRPPGTDAGRKGPQGRRAQRGPSRSRFYAKWSSSCSPSSTTRSHVGHHHRASIGVPHSEWRGAVAPSALRAPQPAINRSAPASSWPAALSSYTNRGGRSEYGRDTTSAFRSSWRRRWESTLGAIPATSSWRSPNRRGPSSRAAMTSRVQRSPIVESASASADRESGSRPSSVCGRVSAISRSYARWRGGADRCHRHAPSANPHVPEARWQGAHVGHASPATVRLPDDECQTVHVLEQASGDLERAQRSGTPQVIWNAPGDLVSCHLQFASKYQERPGESPRPVSEGEGNDCSRGT